MRTMLVLVALWLTTAPAWAVPTLALNGGLHGNLFDNDPVLHGSFYAAGESGGLLVTAAGPFYAGPFASQYTLSFIGWNLLTPDGPLPSIGYNNDIPSWRGDYDPTSHLELTFTRTGDPVRDLFAPNDPTAYSAPVSVTGVIIQKGAPILFLEGEGHTYFHARDVYSASIHPLTTPTEPAPIHTPEPTTWLLLATGFVGLLLWRRRATA